MKYIETTIAGILQNAGENSQDCVSGRLTIINSEMILEYFCL